MKEVEMSETGKLKDREFLHFLDDNVDHILHARMLLEESPKAKVWIDNKRIR